MQHKIGENIDDSIFAKKLHINNFWFNSMKYFCAIERMLIRV